MNQFDILTRSLPRQVDTQSMQDASNSVESGEGTSALPGMESFDTLLEGLIEQPRRDGSKDETALQDPSELSADVNASANTATDVGAAVFALLEGLLPRPMPQDASGHADAVSQQESASSQLLESGLLQGQDRETAIKAPSNARVAVSVQHQETHFSPIVEAADNRIDASGSETAEANPEMAAHEDSVSKLSRKQHLERQSVQFDNEPQQPEAISQALEEQQPVVEEHDAGRVVERVEARKPAMVDSSQPDHGSLPPATLQRIADAVGSEMKGLTGNASPQASSVAEAHRTISFKASESVLRVLKLQLHPAELGVVTIKMKLAGDNLEMELHTESEETAKLLRQDAEKLSSLLRNSGYRPDVITIQVGDTTAQDRVAPQRQSLDMQMQNQSFHQNGASQGDHSRNQEKHYAGVRSDNRKDASEDNSPGNRQSGGIYL